jgi:hypothetical protein
MADGGNNVNDKLLVSLQIFDINRIQAWFSTCTDAEEQGIYNIDVTIGCYHCESDKASSKNVNI